MMIKKNTSVFAIAALFALVLAFTLLPSVSAVEPFGATISPQTPQRAAAANATNDSRAFAGNITEMSVTAYSNTQSWQGYYGNISGTIQLADANNNVLYNWTLAQPSGEIYAVLNSTITWGQIRCFNFSANGTYGAGDHPVGATNSNGLNLSVLEAQFNIASDDVDGVNETFTLQNHDEFYTANLQFAANECRSTRVYSNGGLATDQQFEEVLLYEPTTGSVVFTSIIEETDVAGFNAGFNDFEMLVLEDGHDTNVAATTYFFFVELE